MGKIDEPFPPMFAQFLTACTKEFQILVDDFDFELHEYSTAGYECNVIYRKLPNVALTIMAEAGSTPVVMVTLLKPPESRGNRSFEVSLKRLAKSRNRAWKQKSFSEPTDEQMTDVLISNLTLLRENFPEILEAQDDVGRQMLDLLGRKY